MTKGLALGFLALGTSLLAWGLALSVSVVPDAAPISGMTAASTNDCTDCHPPYPANWQVVPHTLHLTTTQQPTPMACIGCHAFDHNSLRISVSETDMRMLNLRTQIEHIYADYHSGDHEYAVAQQAEAILTLIEADNRWGFHSSAYINTQLDDAESLLNTLAALSR